LLDNFTMTADDLLQFDSTQERYALSRAYVPEHIPSLMTTVSKAKPFLIGDYLGFHKDNWVIFVGYPLEGQFEVEHCSKCVSQTIETQQPEYFLVYWS